MPRLWHACLPTSLLDDQIDERDDSHRDEGSYSHFNRYIAGDR